MLNARDKQDFCPQGGPVYKTVKSAVFCALEEGLSMPESSSQIVISVVGDVSLIKSREIGVWRLNY